jgi:hypothetical protein
MQLRDAQARQRSWQKKGNPPCDHPHITMEYYLSAQTGDYVCTTCGEARWGRGWNKKPANTEPNI